MTIDYRAPKKSYVATPGSNRPRKESSGARLPLFIIIAILVAFATGFGAGWFLSQRSAKKSFQAAMEQTSLESSPQQDTNKRVPPPKAAEPMPTQPPQAQLPPGAAPNPQGAPEPPLSFYKALPNGQKNNVMGSGINAEEKSKQPLQASIPSNLARQTDVAKPGTEKTVAAASARQNTAGGFTVQVASFVLKSEAETMRSKLAGKGYNVYIIESNLGDKGTWYRVRVGKKLEQDAAKELCSKLGKGSSVLPDRD